ncbi:MAG: hypothetical protein AAFV19_07290, partial [Pseudomonadota bacterium]
NVDIDAVATTVDLNGPVTAVTDVNIAAATSATVDDLSAATLSITTTAGAITQNTGSSVVVSGTTTLSAGGAFDVALDQSGNDFDSDGSGDAVNASGTNVTLTDADAIVLGDIDAAGTLTVTAGGAISNDGDGAVAGDDVDVAGVTSLTAGGDILLGDAFNDFDVVDTSAANVTLSDANDIVLGDIDAANNLTVTALGAGSIKNDGDGAAIGDDVNVGGIAGLTAGGDIVLDDAQNDLAVVTGSATNVTLSELGGFAFDAFTASGTADVTTTGAISQIASSAIVIDGVSTLTAGTGFDVSLDQAANDFSEVHAAAANVTLADQNAITLGDLDVTGNFVLTAGGAVADSDATVSGTGINIDGTTNIVAVNSGGAAQNVILDGSANNFDADAGGASDATDDVDVTGADVHLRDEDGLALGSVSVTGDLSVLASGSITDTTGENIVVAGNTSVLAAGSTNAALDILDIDLTDPGVLGDVDFFDIALNSAGNQHDFNTIDFNGEDIAIIDINDLSIIATANADASSDPTLNGDGGLALAVSNDLSVTSIDVEDTVSLSVGGNLDAGSVTAGADVNLDVALDLTAQSIAAAGDVLITGGQAVSLGTSSAGGSSNISAGADLNATTITATANSTISAGGNLTATLLETQTGNLSTVVTGSSTITNVQVGGNTDLRSSGNLTITNEFDVAGSAGATTNGNLTTQDVTAGAVDFSARGDVTVQNVAASGGVSMSSGNVLSLAQITSSGSSINLSADTNFQITGTSTVPLEARNNLTLTSRNGSFQSELGSGTLQDGLTFRARTGDILLDFADGFVILDQPGTAPFTLDAPSGVSVLRVDNGLFAIGSSDFLEEAQSAVFNPFFGGIDINDDILLNVTGDFAMVSDGNLSIRVQNTSTAPNDGQGVVIDGVTFVGGEFSDISLFGSFNGESGEAAALEFRDSSELGLLAFVRDNENTVNGCVILLQSSCQPIGSLTLALEFDTGSLLGITFVDPSEDEDDPFSNRGDEEEWE